jgi:trans-aconitate 2-methyltransferase
MTQLADKTEVKGFYDKFESEDIGLHLSIRHFTIFKELVRSGLKKHHHVLEVGTGYGPVTHLMASYLKGGSVLATDISEGRITAAKQLLKKHRNIEYVVADVAEFSSDRKFDAIVLPDVLEHIPLDDHDRLFEAFARMLKPDGFIFIHIPHPLCIDYIRKHEPETLQIIDQAISSDLLLQRFYKHGFYLVRLESRALSRSFADYQVIVFKRNLPYAGYVLQPQYLIIWRKLWRRIFWWKSCL